MGFDDENMLIPFAGNSRQLGGSHLITTYLHSNRKCSPNSRQMDGNHEKIWCLYSIYCFANINHQPRSTKHHLLVISTVCTLIIFYPQEYKLYHQSVTILLQFPSSPPSQWAPSKRARADSATKVWDVAKTPRYLGRCDR